MDLLTTIIAFCIAITFSIFIARTIAKENRLPQKLFKTVLILIILQIIYRFSHGFGLKQFEPAAKFSYGLTLAVFVTSLFISLVNRSLSQHRTISILIKRIDLVIFYYIFPSIATIFYLYIFFILS